MSSPTQQRPPAAIELELAVFVGEASASHRLPSCGQVSIGRAEDCDVRVDHPSVSRRHAVLHVGPRVRIEDLGSQNGTFVREPRAPDDTTDTEHRRQLARQTADVAVGDHINLGSALLVIRRARPPHAPPGGEPRPPHARTPAMRALEDEVQRVAPTQLNVLVLGETGVGKEVMARTIHRRSRRADGPFVALNCAALPEALVESELFGHERGAFTGASDARPGLFEAAAGGTVFLDEVGELPLHVQVKLLRVLEERRVLRVGGRSPRAIDVRFVSATNRDLEGEVARGAFRQDLFFRLGAVTLWVPPLRERTPEIASLAEVFVAEACRQMDRAAPPSLSERTLALLERYAWPGNIRELRNVLERAAVVCGGTTLLPEHLPAKLRALDVPCAAPSPPRAPAAPPPEDPSPDGPVGASDVARLRSELRELERRRLIEALSRCAGNQTQAAELLGISRRKLVMMLDEYELPRPRKKAPG